MKFGQRRRYPIDHLKVFGCRAFVHVPKDERAKLDSKTKQCIYLGSPRDEFGYQLWDPVNKKIIKSRDVMFFEDQTIKGTKKTEMPVPRVVENSNDSLIPGELKVVKEMSQQSRPTLKKILLSLNYNGHPGKDTLSKWKGLDLDNLNASHLDYYYAFRYLHWSEVGPIRLDELYLLKDKLFFLLTELGVSYLLLHDLHAIFAPTEKDTDEIIVTWKKQEEDEVRCIGYILNVLSDRLLKDLKIEVSNPLQVVALIAKLPTTWNGYITKLLYTSEDFTVDKLIMHIRIEDEICIRDNQFALESSSKVNNIKSNTKKARYFEKKIKFSETSSENFANKKKIKT
ncbi:hypothetical protein ZIOFF_003334 [Zingiber officinale]|uniref:Retroviral polymerase SH3-like domain-containing protein n=1 Tax=Zingiber officinale TaxID=94328 RepID=A0A8J5HY92_ZINOF|nr:hypothetical protein ZIOFF_003334 [Zingiber officinale]